MENTVKFTKNMRGIPHIIPRKHLGTFQLPEIHPSRGKPCFKSSIFRFFVNHNLLWISLTVHACGQKCSQESAFCGPVIKATRDNDSHTEKRLKYSIF